MSIELSGCDAHIAAASVTIVISKQHPLIRLAAVIPWQRFTTMVVADLKLTTAKGFWWMGRKILVRIHLGAYLLQQIFDAPHRGPVCDVECRTNSKPAMEYSWRRSAYQRRSLAIFVGCRALHSHASLEGRKASFISRTSSRLYQEGQSGQRQGVWPCLSDGTDCREFFVCWCMHISTNERQEFIGRHVGRTRLVIRRWRFKISSRRQEH
jgi:hypothetical protein